MKRFFVIALILFSVVLSAKLNWAVFPAGGFNNETGVSVGAISFLRFVPAKADSTHKADSTQKIDSIYLFSMYTQKKQFLISIKPEIHFAKDLYTFSSELDFRKWPSSYYGIGNDNDPDMEERYTPQDYFFDLGISRNLKKYLALSVHASTNAYEILKHEENSYLQIYNDMTNAIGLGIGAKWDSRDAQYYPTKGIYLDISKTIYDKNLKSDYNFSQNYLDLRTYYALNDESLFSWQLISAFSTSNTPFFKLYRLDKYMRGTPSNLSKDRNILVLRNEYKIFPWHGKITKKIGFATFLELGNVFDKIDNYKILENKINYGLGLRYTILPGDKLNFRVDMGFGEHGTEMTIMGTESF